MARTGLRDARRTQIVPHDLRQLVGMQTMTVLRDEQEGCLLAAAPTAAAPRPDTCRARPRPARRSARSGPSGPCRRRTSRVRALPVDVGELQPQRFVPPQARGVQHLQNGPIPQAVRRGEIGLCQDRFHFLDRQRMAGQSPFVARQLQVVGRIVRQDRAPAPARRTTAAAR